MLVSIIFVCLLIFLLMLAYPLLALVRSKLYPVPVRKDQHFEVPVSIIIAGYKEDDYLAAKVHSFLDPEEWIEGSEILLVVSGATERTLEIISDLESSGKVRAFVSKGRMSKIDSVNLAVSEASRDILVFSDCRQPMKRGSVRGMIRNFKDETVGTVASTLEDSWQTGRSSFPRKVINFTSLSESKSGSSLNVYGALYAQRREVFRAFPPTIIFDDLFVVVSTLLQHKRLIQEECAVIYDVNFGAYYQAERIERLARGLLLFLTEHGSMIRKLKFGDQSRLLIFKYLKLILPLVFLIFSGAMMMEFPYFSYQKLYQFSGFMLIALVLIKRTRNFLFLLARVNYHFFLMVFKYFFLMQRSTSWEKLKVDSGIDSQGK